MKIEVTQTQLEIIVQLAQRAPMSAAEQYALASIVRDINATIAAKQKQDIATEG